MKPGTIVFRGQTKKGREIVVRYPLGSDVSALRNYINTLSREKTFIRFQGEQVSLADERKYLNSYLKKMKKSEAVKLMVFCQNKLVAVSNINLKDKISGHVGVFGVTVTKSFRNEGIGKLLMKLVFKEAKKIKKLKIITLEIFANNPVALRLYRKRFGFKEYGRLPQGIKHRGKFVDDIFLYKKV